MVLPLPLALKLSWPETAFEVPSVRPLEALTATILLLELSFASKMSAEPLLAAYRTPATVPLVAAWTLKFASCVAVESTMTEVPL